MRYKGITACKISWSGVLPMSVTKLIEFVSRLSPTECNAFEAGWGALKTKREAAAKEARKAVDYAQSLGVDLQSFMPTQVPLVHAIPANGNGNGHHKATKPVKVAPKAKAVIRYRDPANPSRTWTGRGRAPGWIVGKDRAPFAVGATA